MQGEFYSSRDEEGDSSIEEGWKCLRVGAKQQINHDRKVKERQAGRGADREVCECVQHWFMCAGEIGFESSSSYNVDE